MDDDTPVKVQVIELTGMKLEPGASYIIAFDQARTHPGNIRQVANMMREQKMVPMMLPTKGDPSEVLKIYEVMPPEDTKND